jgi:hypothetical protein
MVNNNGINKHLTRDKKNMDGKTNLGDHKLALSDKVVTLHQSKDLCASLPLLTPLLICRKPYFYPWTRNESLLF